MLSDQSWEGGVLIKRNVPTTCKLTTRSRFGRQLFNDIARKCHRDQVDPVSALPVQAP
jgi:hypothetical protein